jgi:parallel beta-helix repeat protein
LREERRMSCKKVAGIMLSLLLTSMLAVASGVPSVEANLSINSVQPEASMVPTQLGLFVVFNSGMNDLWLAANLTDNEGNPVAGETIVFGWRRNPPHINEPFLTLGTATTNAAGLARFNTGFVGFSGSYSMRALHQQHLNFSASESIVNIVLPSGRVIRIKSDGSIDPPSAPIVKNGDSYVLTDDIIADSAGISIERDNISLDGAGHLIQPLPYIIGQYGIGLSGRTNIRVENVHIRSFFYHIDLSDSSNNTIRRNKLIGSEYQTLLWGQFTIFEFGLLLWDSTNNIISQNEVRNTLEGMILISSFDNKIYHNNFVNNIYMQIDTDKLANAWDDGYPSGGNYWSDYTDADYNGDGIGDSPYIIDEINLDRYPLVNPYVPLFGDVNDDRQIDGKDIAIIAKAFASYPGHPRWIPEADINHDSKIEGKDIALVAKSFGKTYQ